MATQRTKCLCGDGKDACMSQECANSFGRNVSGCHIIKNVGPITDPAALAEGDHVYDWDNFKRVGIWDVSAQRVIYPIPGDHEGYAATLPDGSVVRLDDRHTTGGVHCAEEVVETWKVDPPLGHLDCDAVLDAIRKKPLEVVEAIAANKPACDALAALLIADTAAPAP